ncbi:MAG: hypothetical protein OHK0019_28270 [Saprospiraceae bacterium]
MQDYKIISGYRFANGLQGFAKPFRADGAFAPYNTAGYWLTRYFTGRHWDAIARYC